jgi:multisubunit Na+/H+ antiporter MnhF subunit
VKIVYRAVYMSAVAGFALQTLRSLSPVGSGDDPHIGLYRDSHLLFLNGHVVADVSNWKPGDQVAIANPVPYSRLIEIGILKMRVPGSDHVYQRAEIIVRARYGTMVDVKFAYMPVRFANTIAAARFARREGKDRDTRASSLKEQPALIITARAA